MKKQNTKKFVQKYFADELNEAVNGMSYEEMVTLLKELESTQYWVATIKYVQDRMTIAQGSLCMLDPITQATAISRAQGILSGLLDLQDMISKSKQTAKQAEDEANAKNDQSPDVPDIEGFGN